jgi:hypothetical protein
MRATGKDKEHCLGDAGGALLIAGSPPRRSVNERDVSVDEPAEAFGRTPQRDSAQTFAIGHCFFADGFHDLRFAGVL